MEGLGRFRDGVSGVRVSDEGGGGPWRWGGERSCGGRR